MLKHVRVVRAARQRRKARPFIVVHGRRFVGTQEAIGEAAGTAIVAPMTIAEEVGAPAQQAHTAVASASASMGDAAPQGAPDRSTVEMVERAVFLHHPYENRERLRSILPRETSAQVLDRVLDHLERSGRIAIDGEVIRWASDAGKSDAVGQVDGEGASGDKSILAGTRFEWMEEDKLPTETIGEYIARIYNAHEPGSYTAEDAREFDEGMRRMAKGDYYTHEQVWKEFGS